MPTIPNFDIAQHLKVEMFLPFEADNLFLIGLSLIGSDDVLGSSTAFIIGTSLIGGTDVLSDETLPGFAWQPFEAITTKCDIELGGSIRDALYFQPEPAMLSVNMQSFQYDPSVNKSVRPGSRIRVRLDDGITSQTLFNGYMDSIDVIYGAEGDGWNSISIKAYDAHKRIVNTRVAEFDTTPYGSEHVTPLEVIATAVIGAGYDMSLDSLPLFGKMPHFTDTDVIVSPYILDAIQVGLGIMWVDPETEEVIAIPRPTVVTTAPEGTWTIGNNHGDPYHLCMSDIAVRADGDVTFNSLRVANKNDPTEYVVKIDQDNIDLYGMFALDTEINTTPDGQLVKWTDEVFAQSPTKLVNQVETPTIDRLGVLTDAAFFTPGTLLGVKYDKAPLAINDYYTIIKTIHSIEVDNWFTTMELWKEF